MNTDLFSSNKSHLIGLVLFLIPLGFDTPKLASAFLRVVNSYS